MEIFFLTSSSSLVFFVMLHSGHLNTGIRLPTLPMNSPLVDPIPSWAPEEPCPIIPGKFPISTLRWLAKPAGIIWWFCRPKEPKLRWEFIPIGYWSLRSIGVVLSKSFKFYIFIFALKHAISTSLAPKNVEPAAVLCVRLPIRRCIWIIWGVGTPWAWWLNIWLSMLLNTKNHPNNTKYLTI